jgi:hypothetical protein
MLPNAVLAQDTPGHSAQIIAPAQNLEEVATALGLSQLTVISGTE